MKQGHLGNEQVQARLKGRDRDKFRQQEDDLKNVLSTHTGRRVLWRIIRGWAADVTGTFSISMTGNSQTFFNEGQRSVAVRVMQECQRVSPLDYVAMLTEQLQRQKEEDLQRKDAVTQAEKDEPS